MNTLSIVVAAVVSFIVGMLWYGPLFGKTWMKLAGISMEDMKSMGMSPAKAMTLGFVSSLIVAYVLARFMSILNTGDISSAAELAFWVWFGFAMPIQSGAWLWEGKSFKLFAFNATYQIIVYVLMACALILV